ncbi:MAG: hypothetical protein CMH64_04185 [Nanoarchaeota archaeon]|nr:hypothetical protein [Nanoarchaeota archaeon]|tara:strand:+ start:1105 stop:1446 length:342 start_codon:yes stop_codon:yes gene_type:complete
MEETENYLRKLQDEREGGSLKLISTSHGVIPIATKDLNDYVSPYMEGFVRTKREYDWLKIASAGTFNEEYVEDRVDWANGRRGVKSTTGKKESPRSFFIQTKCLLTVICLIEL